MKSIVFNEKNGELIFNNAKQEFECEKLIYFDKVKCIFKVKDNFNNVYVTNLANKYFVMLTSKSEIIFEH